MTVLLCRNRVSDFARWKAVFDSHAAAHREAGLQLLNVWRSLKDPDDVFFLFQVSALDKARGFIGDPAAAQAGQESGVLDGEYHFLESAPGYSGSSHRYGE